MSGLTPMQQKTLNFITAYAAGHDGIAPTYEEIRTELNLASKSGVNRLLNGLGERGRVRRQKHRSRAIEVLAPTSVTLKPDIFAMLEAYALDTRTTVEVAVNEILRDAFGDA